MRVTAFITDTPSGVVAGQLAGPLMCGNGGSGPQSADDATKGAPDAEPARDGPLSAAELPPIPLKEEEALTSAADADGFR